MTRTPQRAQAVPGALGAVRMDGELPLRTDDDGSVELHFAPRPPHGPEWNRVPTVSGQGWFSYFRPCGPLESYFDRSGKLGDIRPVQA